MQREVAFLGVDEIQLAADHERGHVFTDRLLHARGTEETMFLGSDTVRPILKRLVPEAEVISRPRFSILSFAGDSKLHRLPRRSVVVAFSAAEVYTLAEVIRRQKGGAAVVLGALSPRTRNAQVAHVPGGRGRASGRHRRDRHGPQHGRGHVAFAGLAKFDGTRAPAPARARDGPDRRPGRPPHGQRHVRRDQWLRAVRAARGRGDREPYLPAAEMPALAQQRVGLRQHRGPDASLDRAPGLDCLVKVRDAIDHRSLLFLSRRDEVRAALGSQERVRLLWQVCQIPDFRKTLTDAHLHLLATVFSHLTGPRACCPTTGSAPCWRSSSGSMATSTRW